MTAAQEKKKRAVISALAEARKRLLDTASTLPPGQQDEVFLGIWSVKDLLAHLIGWDFANMEAVTAILDGQLPAFYAHYDRDWQSFNARLVAQYKRDDFAELVAAVEASHKELVALLEAVPAAEFGRAACLRWKGYRMTIAAILQTEADDEKTHCAQVGAFASSR